MKRSSQIVGFLATGTLALVSAWSALASASTDTGAALDAYQRIGSIANLVCVHPQLFGAVRSADGKISGQVALSKLTKALGDANIGASLGGGYSDWRGVRQQDAAAALNSANECGERLFTLMLTRLKLVDRTTGKPVRRRKATSVSGGQIGEISTGPVIGSCINIGGNNNSPCANIVKKYSSQQSVIVAPSSLGGRDYISLDNAARMHMGLKGDGTPPYTDTSITLIFDPSVVGYKATSPPDTKIEDAQIMIANSSDYMVFDIMGERSHRVEVSGRKFDVKLLQVKPTNIPDIAFSREYIFGINEN